MPCPWRAPVRATSLALTLLGLLLRADVPASAQTNAPAAATASLEFQEAGSSFINWGLSVMPQDAPFRKEPADLAGKVIRGVLVFDGQSSNSLPFLWQRDTGKLFLDLNRNRDLTDDSNGVFSVPGQRQLSSQTFPNVPLPFNLPQGQCHMFADLVLQSTGARVSCILELRSFWQGKVTLQGRDWQVGLVPEIGSAFLSLEKGRLLLRPWESRLKARDNYLDSLDLFTFPRQLFFGGHAYQLEARVAAQNGEVRPELTFTEQPVALGELKITGSYIERLVFSGGEYLVVLDQPEPTVKIPNGSYAQPRVLIAQGGTKALSKASSAPVGGRIVVNGQAPATLAVGGPLTNTVAASRRGSELLLDYQLVGVGGTVYQLQPEDRSHPPEFTIFKGDRKLASGKFEFG
jgi:hypothetical protein